jgi:hypothetical protein
MPSVRAISTFLASSLAALACAGGAFAHECASHVGFVSTVSTIDPFVPGLLVRVIGGHERLSVTNLTRKTIVIFDRSGRPVARIPPGENRVWTEPRVGATDEPPEREGLVRNWRIPGTSDGEPFEIVGFLGYRPPPGEPAQADGSGLPGWAIALVAAGGALLLMAALALPLRRRKGES